MGLDNATVKEFANLINPFDKTSGEATVYGRVVGFNEVGGRPIVNLDGSSQRIPIRTTVKVKGPKGSQGDPDYYAGDRVLVRIKNHEALIVSNISTQMTTLDETKGYLADNGFIYAEQISAEQGDFHYLSADVLNTTFLEVTRLTAESGDFHYLSSEKLVSDTVGANLITSDTGTFHYLTADSLNAAYLDVKMANLDTANINRASVNQLLVKGFAIATDATIVNGHITGYLDSVEVNANKITAGTLLVDRLYIKDQSTNNKWKMLTVDGQGHTVYVEAADRINERTITADKLVAHSITTDELNVSNLTAGDSVFMTALTNTLEAEEIFVSYEEADSIIAGKIAADLAELDILNINEELKTQNIHLGEIVFDQPSKPEVMSGNPDYLLGIERETKTISAYDDTSLYSEGEYVTHYYSKDNINTYPYNQTTITVNGITFTDNGDGSITCNGTATANATFSVHARVGTATHNREKSKLVLPNGTYILSGSPEGSLTSTYYMDVGRTVNSKNKRIGRATSDPLTFTANGDDSSADEIKPYIDIVVLNGQTVNNLTFYPKIRLATNEDTNWYPFVKGVYKCIKPITTAELWDENKWYYLRDAINGDQYEFDHVRYANKVKANELHLGDIFFDQTNKPTANENPTFFLNIDAYADGGGVHYGTFPLKIGLGGTGATTAAGARANLATPAMVTSSYPALLPTNGSNNWIQIGTADGYGLLPSQPGDYASGGHNYLGTSYWYWANLYVHNINGVAVGTSPKFTDTNTWPSNYDSLYYRKNMTAYTRINGFGTILYIVSLLDGGAVANYIIAGVEQLDGTAVNKIWGTSTWSDEKIKMNIKESDVIAMNIINALEPKEFDYIDTKYGGHVDLGFTAQNVEKYIPEAVLECPQTVNDEGQDITIKALDYQRVVPYLIKAIQEQQEQIDELKQEIKELKEEN